MNKGFIAVFLAVILCAAGLIFFLQPGGDKLFSSSPSSPSASRPQSDGADAPAGRPEAETSGDRDATGVQAAAPRGGEAPASAPSGTESPTGGSTQPATAETSAETTPPPATTRAEGPKSPEPVRDADLSSTASHILRGITLEVSGQKVVLRIESDEPFPVKTFLLPNPNRLVVDLPGEWKDMKAPTVPQNRLIRSARLGTQSSGPRLVLDLRAQLANRSVERPDPNTVEVILE